MNLLARLFGLDTTPFKVTRIDDGENRITVIVTIGDITLRLDAGDFSRALALHESVTAQIVRDTDVPTDPKSDGISGPERP